MTQEFVSEAGGQEFFLDQIGRAKAFRETGVELVEHARGVGRMPEARQVERGAQLSERLFCRCATPSARRKLALAAASGPPRRSSRSAFQAMQLRLAQGGLRRFGDLSRQRKCR